MADIIIEELFSATDARLINDGLLIDTNSINVNLLNFNSVENEEFNSNLLIDIISNIYIDTINFIANDNAIFETANLLVDTNNEFININAIDGINSQMEYTNMLVGTNIEIICSNINCIDGAKFIIKKLSIGAGASTTATITNFKAKTVQFKTGLVIGVNAICVAAPFLSSVATLTNKSNFTIQDNSDNVIDVIFNSVSATTFKTGVTIATTNPSRIIRPSIFNGLTSQMKTSVVISANDGRMSVDTNVSKISVANTLMKKIKVFSSIMNLAPFEIESDFSLGIFIDTSIDEYYNLIIK